MEANPYASPAFDDSLRGSSFPLKLAAVVCWFLSALPWLALSAQTKVDFWLHALEGAEGDPIILVIGFLFLVLLPSAGFSLLGLAGWRRKWWPALVGAPICLFEISFVVYALCW